MAIDKSLYTTSVPPITGTDEDIEDELSMDLLDVTVEEDEGLASNVVELEDGGVEITMLGPSPVQDIPFDANLAEYMEEDELEKLAQDVLGLISGDIDSRKEWAETFVDGLDVLGLKYEERSDPWENACGTYSTVLSEAAIRFQAETMSETFPAAGPVKTKIIGEETPEKLEAAERVRADMNYELTEQMVEYRPEHERMLWSLGLAGSAFKKIYEDPTRGRQTAMFVSAEDMVVPYGASHIETAERATHIMRKTPNEILKLQDSGFYADIDLGDPVPFHTDIDEHKAEEEGVEINEDNRYTLFESHIEYVLDGIDSDRLVLGDEEEEEEEDTNEIAKPYVITIDKGTSKVLAIYRNWEEGDALKLKKQHFVHYMYVPGFGFYGMGLIHIVGGYARTGTSLIRQLVDAGTLANLPGGLKTRGLRIKNDDETISPGEFKDVDVPSGSIRDNIMPLPYKEPSQTLLLLLERITTEGRRLGAISDMDISDMSANAPVGTTLALLERTLKPMAAVQSRVHYSMKLEFKLLKNLMANYAGSEYGYKPHRGEISAKDTDYDLVEIIPVSDPNSTTMAQRVIQYQTAMQMSTQAPHIYDERVLHRQMLEVIGIPNSDKIVPVPDDMEPMDPISENMNVLVGKPVKAFLYQDHQAHLTTHQMFMQDPAIAQMIGQNPAAQRIMGSLQAHIAEHLGMAYRNEMEKRMGATLPPPGQPLPKEVEVSLSQLTASAGTQLTQQNQQRAAQQEAQQKAEDPVMQLNKQKQDNADAELQRKMIKDKVDAELKQREQTRKEAKDKIDARLEAAGLTLEEREVKIKELELQLNSRQVGESAALERKKHNSSLDLEIMKLLETSKRDTKNGSESK
jgi:hypothetical protein